jgi:hypothetical protein
MLGKAQEVSLLSSLPPQIAWSFLDPNTLLFRSIHACLTLSLSFLVEANEKRGSWAKVFHLPIQEYFLNILYVKT